MDYLKPPSSRLDWIINTPERKEILSEGAPKHANLNLLGKGAFGSVFKAIFQDRPVALKIVKNRNEMNRTENEANILGWRHRNIVEILMIESTIKYGLIIMEHFPSQSLQEILYAIELPLYHRVLISIDILNALGYCHFHKLLHLDIKPQNVLVALNIKSLGNANKLKSSEKNKRLYCCKLCDFGSSLKLDDQKAKKVNAGGTIRYMSPEVLRAEELTPAADIFSLGILMWQLQKRRTPYESIQCNEIVAFQVVKNNLRPNLDLRRSMLQNPAMASHSPQLQRCICRCFSTESRRNSKSQINLNDLAGSSTFKRGCYSDRKNISLTLSISPNPRNGRTIQVLRSPALRKVARNLSKDLDFGSVEKIPINEKTFQLKSLFETAYKWSNKTLKVKESLYSNIYELCWQAEPERRPKIKVLKSNLKEVLKINS